MVTVLGVGCQAAAEVQGVPPSLPPRHPPYNSVQGQIAAAALLSGLPLLGQGAEGFPAQLLAEATVIQDDMSSRYKTGNAALQGCPPSASCQTTGHNGKELREQSSARMPGAHKHFLSFAASCKDLAEAPDGMQRIPHIFPLSFARIRLP
mmetsp:Transcript_21814/g.52128  ORF Transcript_21814/g.52128 Transcript_21814/m.52128 type:complete len:150 (-) Transcript_21814:431-880(-)